MSVDVTTVACATDTESVPPVSVGLLASEFSGSVLYSTSVVSRSVLWQKVPESRSELLLSKSCTRQSSHGQPQMASLVAQPPSALIPTSSQGSCSVLGGNEVSQFIACPDPSAHAEFQRTANPREEPNSDALRTNNDANINSVRTEGTPTMSNVHENDRPDVSHQHGDGVDVPAQSTDTPRVAAAGSEEGKQQTTEKKVSFQAAVDGDEDHLTLREEYVDRVWDDFVTQFLLGSNHIQRAAIFDLASRRCLASRGGINIAPEEMEQLVASLHYTDLAYRNGVTIGGRSYKVRLADGRHGIMARTEREGCSVCKTQTLIIIGVHDENGSSRRCNEEVMRLGDFFRRKAL